MSGFDLNAGIRNRIIAIDERPATAARRGQGHAGRCRRWRGETPVARADWRTATPQHGSSPSSHPRRTGRRAGRARGTGRWRSRAPTGCQPTLRGPLPYALLTRRQRPSTHDTLQHHPVSGVCGSLVSRRRAHKPPSRTAATPLTSYVHARHVHTAHVHTRDVHQRPDAPITLQPENRHAHVPTYPSLECMPYARKLGSK